MQCNVGQLEVHKAHNLKVDGPNPSIAPFWVFHIGLFLSNFSVNEKRFHFIYKI